jgi:hypothetical protein
MVCGNQQFTNTHSLLDRVLDVIPETMAVLDELLVDEIDNAALSDVVVSLASLRARLDAAEARVVRRLHASRETIRESGNVTATWMSNTLHRPRARCSRLVKTAKAMIGPFSVLGDAVNDPDSVFNLDHLEVVVSVSNHRIETLVIEIQEQLVQLAGACTFTEFEREMRSLANLLDQDGDFDPNAEHEKSWIRIRHTGTGIDLDGHLEGTLGATVAKALNEIADRLFRDGESDAATDETVRGRGQLLAQALAEMARNRDTPGSAPIVEMTFVVTDPAETADSAETTDGVRVEGAVLDFVSCDAVTRTLTVTRFGEPLNLGRARRLASESQRRAAHIRDRGCVFPNCDAPVSWTDLHHVQHWRHGGPTDLQNLACLCRRHHGVVHSKGWSMARGPDGSWVFTTPTGRTLTSHPPGHHKQPAA